MKWIFLEICLNIQPKEGQLVLMYWQVWSCLWAPSLCDDEGEASIPGRALVAKPLHNTFYVTDMVATLFSMTTQHIIMITSNNSWIAISDKWWWRHCTVKKNVIQYNLSPIIENISQTQPCFYCKFRFKELWPIEQTHMEHIQKFSQDTFDR